MHIFLFLKIRNINEALNSVITEKRLREEGLDPQKIADYMKQVRLRTIKVTKKGVEEDTGGTFIIAYLLVFILYMTLFIYGSIIMRGVLENNLKNVYFLGEASEENKGDFFDSADVLVLPSTFRNYDGENIWNRCSRPDTVSNLGIFWNCNYTIW